jgi:hypothetical protein
MAAFAGQQRAAKAARFTDDRQLVVLRSKLDECLIRGFGLCRQTGYLPGLGWLQCDVSI